MDAIVRPFAGRAPSFGAGVFLAPGAVVIGDVRLRDRVSVWPAAVLRGDVHRIEIGADSNVQDGAVLHGLLDELPVIVGERVSIAHHATVHGATLEDDVLVGIGARVLDGCRVGRLCLIAAGAVLRERSIVPERSLVAGIPAAVKRPLTDNEIERILRTPKRYRDLAEQYARSDGTTRG